MESFDSIIKTCKGYHSGYNVDCLTKYLAKMECDNIEKFSDKRLCYINQFKLERLINFVKSDSNFENKLLPVVLADMMQHCQDIVKNGNSKALLSLNDSDTFSTTRRNQIDQIRKYPLYGKFGIMRIQANLSVFHVDCEKLFDSALSGVKNSNTGQESFFQISIQY